MLAVAWDITAGSAAAERVAGHTVAQAVAEPEAVVPADQQDLHADTYTINDLIIFIQCTEHFVSAGT